MLSKPRYCPPRLGGDERSGVGNVCENRTPLFEGTPPSRRKI